MLLYCVLALPRRGALLAMASGVLYLTQHQSIDLAGFNFYAMRFLEIAGFVRVIARHEYSFGSFNRIDRALVTVYVFTTAVYLLRSGEGSFAMIGKMMDIFLCYFAFRGLVRDIDDLRWFLGAFAVALIPYVFFLGLERFAHINPFVYLGGDKDAMWLRDDRIRCIGSFRHPSLLGSLGATFLPLYIALLWDRAWQKAALLGGLLCTAIVVFSNSGGPLSAWVFGLLAWGFWFLRDRMRMVRWSIVGALCVLALVMNAPVYYLLARVSSVTGGTGWHRSYLIQVALENFNKWGLIGMQPSETADWFVYSLADGNADITNQFLAFGIFAGIAAIVLFFVLLIRTFQLLGQALAITRTLEQGKEELLLWGLGATVAVHMVNWLGITYFDQFNVLWMLQLASISTISTLMLVNGEKAVGAQGCDGAELEIAATGSQV